MSTDRELQQRQLLKQRISELSPEDADTLREEAQALVRGRYDTAFFAEYWLGLKLNPFQKRFFSAIDAEDKKGNFIQVVTPTANQCGKTVADAVLHIKWPFYKKGMELDETTFEKSFYQTLNLSPVLRQTKICMQYVEQILTSTFSWTEDGKSKVNKCRMQNFLRSKNENMGRLEYANGALTYFVSTGEDQAANIQGAQFGAVTYDECCLSGHLQDELPSKILSRLAKYGSLLVLIASPKSEERSNSLQYFFHLARDAKRGKNDFIYVDGVFDENIFIPEEQRERIKQRLRALSENAYQEVIFGKFVSSSSQFFPPHIIDAIWNGKQAYGQPLPERKYAIMVDWGFAEQGDKTVFGIFDYTEHPVQYELVYGYTERGGEPFKLAAMLAILKKTWNDARVMMDTVAMGGWLMKKVAKDLHPLSYNSQGDVKAKSLEKLFFLLTEPENRVINGFGRIKAYYLPELESELSSYKLEDKKLEQDWVMVLAMFAYFIKSYLAVSDKPTLLSMRARYNSLRNHGH